VSTSSLFEFYAAPLNAVLAFSPPMVYWQKREVHFMQLAFSWWQLFDVLLSILWLISGIRDFMGKDPLIRLPFNQYERDPEYRAFWQKKNGVLFTFNAVVSLLDTFLPQAPWGGSWLLVAVVVDILYLVAYEAWEHSDD
uniref:hypothetical protein n=1 Tax=Faecalibacterium sp. TaxID=1971605 RepID=UPI0040267935